MKLLYIAINFISAVAIFLAPLNTTNIFPKLGEFNKTFLNIYLKNCTYSIVNSDILY